MRSGVADAARATGPPCNVIDRPALPVRLDLEPLAGRGGDRHKGGGAPILARAIRRRIETLLLLPPSLADRAALAVRLRGAVIDRLAP